MPDQLCSHLPWDSDFFGFRIGRYCSHALTEDKAAAAVDWCRREGINCLYVLVDDDPRNVAVAEQCGFLHVDTRITLVHHPAEQSGGSTAAQLRLAGTSDIPQLKQIARYSHYDSRFYHDPHFPRDVCDKFYETWIERSCAGWAERVFVAADGSGPAGYVTCHGTGREGSIGLIAVAPEHRGNGYGSRLIAGALADFSRRGAETVRVVTQERNREGLRLYGHRFSIESRQIYYHAWFEERGCR